MKRIHELEEQVSQLSMRQTDITEQHALAEIRVSFSFFELAI
jgi:hypothetical protein